VPYRTVFVDFELIKKNKNRLHFSYYTFCLFFYDFSLPTESKGQWMFTDFTRDENRMAHLFEKFIYRFYKIEMPHLKPKSEHFNWNFDSDNPDDKRYLPLMKTDISLEGAVPKIIIDTKYYQETMRESFNKETVKSENLYQLFSYLINQQDGTDKTAKTKGILLYPTIHTEYNLHYRFQEHDIHIKTVNLNTHWSKIEERLLEIIS